MNLTTLINLWLDINYQVTTKYATVPKSNNEICYSTQTQIFSPTKHTLTIACVCEDQQERKTFLIEVQHHVIFFLARRSTQEEEI